MGEENKHNRELESKETQEVTVKRTPWRLTKVVWNRMLQTTTHYNQMAQGIFISQACLGDLILTL